jgi:hypothetical protein
MGTVARRRSALLPALLLTALAACSGAEDRARDAVEARRVEPSTSPSAAAPSSAPVPRFQPLALDGDVVALPHERYLSMWERPDGDGADFVLDTRNPTGKLAPLLIERAALVRGEPWFEVLLPLRPNGASAWVRERDVEVRDRTERIEVDLSRRLLWHFVGEEVAHRFRVGVGTPATPTGTGRFYVWVKVSYADPGGPYGAAALGLSGFSPVLSDWPGEGRMAVHGTADPADRGRAVSHGCVRVFNEDLAALVDVPLGTPVLVHT